MPDSKVVQSILDSLRRIVRALRSATKHSEKDLGLRTAQLFVLQQIRDFAPLSINELAEKTYSHQSTVSVVVTGLVENGLVRREASKEDRRKTVLRLSEQGRALLRKRRTLVQENIAAAIHRMPEKDGRRLAELLAEFVIQAGLSGDTAHFFFEEPPAARPKTSKK